MPNTNAFEGLDYYSVDLIQYKTKRLIGYLGITHSDREDIEQELAIHLRRMLPKHDPRRGTLKTFINCVLDNKVRAIITSRTCSTLDCRLHDCSLDTIAESAGFDEFTTADRLNADDHRIMLGNAARSMIEEIELQVDVRRAVALLPERLQAVCRQLLRATVADAAGELGMSRGKLYYTMRRLRDLLSEAGLAEYFKK